MFHSSAMQYEGQEARELKQIFTGQEIIQRSVMDLQRKLDEVIGRQERTLSQLSIMAQMGGAQQGQGQGQAGQVPQLPLVDTIKRHEVDTLMANNRDLTNQIRDIRSVCSHWQSYSVFTNRIFWYWHIWTCITILLYRSVLNDVHSRSKNIGTGGAGVAYDGTSHFNEIKGHMNALQADFKQLMNKPQVSEIQNVSWDTYSCFNCCYSEIIRATYCTLCLYVIFHYRALAQYLVLTYHKSAVYLRLCLSSVFYYNWDSC